MHCGSEHNLIRSAAVSPPSRGPQPSTSTAQAATLEHARRLTRTWLEAAALKHVHGSGMACSARPFGPPSAAWRVRRGCTRGAPGLSIGSARLAAASSGAGEGKRPTAPG